MNWFVLARNVRVSFESNYVAAFIPSNLEDATFFDATLQCCLQNDFKNVVVHGENSICGASGETHEHNFHIVNCSTIFRIASELISFCGIV